MAVTKKSVVSKNTAKKPAKKSGAKVASQASSSKLNTTTMLGRY